MVAPQEDDDAAAAAATFHDDAYMDSIGGGANNNTAQQQSGALVVESLNVGSAADNEDESEDMDRASVQVAEALPVEEDRGWIDDDDDDDEAEAASNVDPVLFVLPQDDDTTRMTTRPEEDGDTTTTTNNNNSIISGMNEDDDDSQDNPEAELDEAVAREATLGSDEEDDATAADIDNDTTSGDDSDQNDEEFGSTALSGDDQFHDEPPPGDDEEEEIIGVPMALDHTTETSVEYETNNNNSSSQQEEEESRNNGGTVEEEEEKVADGTSSNWERDKLFWLLAAAGSCCCLAILLAILVLAVVLSGGGKTGGSSSGGGSVEPEAAESAMYQVTSFVLDLPNDSKDRIQANKHAPQHKAYKWLLDDPSLVAHTQEKKIQRFAMATLYYAMRGDEWTEYSNNWLSYDTDECAWTQQQQQQAPPTAVIRAKDNDDDDDDDDAGWNCWQLPNTGSISIVEQRNIFKHATPKNGGSDDGRKKDGQLRLLRKRRTLQEQNTTEVLPPPPPPPVWGLRRLHIPANNLVGDFPPEFALLTNLESMDLSSNTIFGDLHDTSDGVGLFGDMPHMKAVNISHNLLTGPIPRNLRFMSQLQVLDVSHNQLMQPSATPGDGFSNHTSIQPSSTRGSGFFSPFFQLSHVNLAFNTIAGSVNTIVPFTKDNSPGSFEQLTSLQLQHNQLVGSLPSFLGLLTNLEHLELDDNNLLSGPLPTELGLLERLEDLLLYNNNLEGSLLGSALERMTSLQVIGLSGNQLTGSLPAELGLLTQLREVWLYGNKLTGPVPKELERLLGSDGELAALIIYDNQLTGIMPAELCELDDALQFDCVENMLCGCNYCACDGEAGEDGNNIAAGNGEESGTTEEVDTGNTDGATDNESPGEPQMPNNDNADIESSSTNFPSILSNIDGSFPQEPTDGFLITAAPTEGAINTPAPTEDATSTTVPTEGAISTAAPAEGSAETDIENPEVEICTAPNGDSISTLELKEGFLTMSFLAGNSGLFSFLGSNSKLMQETFVSVYNAVMEGCDGEYSRVLQPTLAYNMTSATQGGETELTIKWTASVLCDGCWDNEPLFADVPSRSSSRTKGRQLRILSDTKMATVANQLAERISALYQAFDADAGPTEAVYIATLATTDGVIIEEAGVGIGDDDDDDDDDDDGSGGGTASDGAVDGSAGTAGVPDRPTAL